AIQYLLSRQDTKGMFRGKKPSRHPVYDHAIATYAVSEAYGMTRVPALKTAMEGGMKNIINGQQPGGGWDYHYKKGDRRDTSVSGWHVQAMKAAHLSGAENPGIKEAMKRSIADFKSVFNPSSGRFAYSTGSSGSEGMTGVGVLSMQFLGQGNSPEVRGGLKFLDSIKGEWKKDAPKNPMYAWYYITQAKFHKGGKTWSAWNKKFSKELVAAQHEDGHWGAPDGTDGESGEGPVYTTTLGALMLQVYYRNLPTFKEDAAKEEEFAPEAGSDDVVIEIL
ncbi:MAG: hypothetical protein AAF492_25220, partial [Verrucomicrobiota bacterium]